MWERPLHRSAGEAEMLDFEEQPMLAAPVVAEDKPSISLQSISPYRFFSGKLFHCRRTICSGI